MIEYTVKVSSNGSKSWWLEGKRHREDGPAVEWADGTKSWWLNGKRHREDGPAVEWYDGYKAWYLNGKELSEKKFNQRVNPKPCLGKKVMVDGVEYTLT